MSAKIKFGVVGFGHIGKRHAAMINGNDESEVIAVADVSEDRQLEAKEILGERATVYASIEDLLKNPEVDIVNICTPNGWHAKQALWTLEAKKHVVIEKPMGLNRQECEEVIFKSLQVSKHAFIVKQNRYSPTSVWLKSLIDERKLDETYMVQMNCYWNRDDRYYKKGGWKGLKNMDGGVLFTQFSHFLDIMYWLFGDIKNINAKFQNFNHKTSTEFIDSGFVGFEFINGGLGTINFSTSIWGQNMESSIAIIGEKGSVKVSGQYMDTVSHCVVEDYEMPTLPPANPPNDYGDYKGSAANHHYVIENVVNVLKGRSQITTNALEGMKVVEMIERIYQEGTYLG
jgi:UDP-N-acetyl-2-amino-2-deoxyglucuronate dehydrogenase